MSGDKPKLEGPRNALEWFKAEYCGNCPRQEICSYEDRTRCILANILFELVNYHGYVTNAEKNAKEAVKQAELLLKQDKWRERAKRERADK